MATRPISRLALLGRPKRVRRLSLAELEALASEARAVRGDGS